MCVFATNLNVVNEIQLLFPKAMHKQFKQCSMREEGIEREIESGRDKTMTLNVLCNN